MILTFTDLVQSGKLYVLKFCLYEYERMKVELNLGNMFKMK